MQVHRIVRALLYVPDRIQAKLDPVAFARRKGVKLGRGVRFYGMPHLGTEPWLITLGDNVHVTKGVEFLNHDGATLILRKDTPDLEITKPIVIGSDVYIGVNSIILPGVTIGNRCVVGAGSVVSRSVPENSVVAGVPARVIKTVDEYEEKVKRESLHLGHLSARAKERALRDIFGVDG